MGDPEAAGQALKAQPARMRGHQSFALVQIAGAGRRRIGSGPVCNTPTASEQALEVACQLINGHADGGWVGCVHRGLQK
jgi:hypothetical protein